MGGVNGMLAEMDRDATVAMHADGVSSYAIAKTLNAEGSARGKGRKQRRVPISFELRKHLHRYITDFGRKPHGLLLATRAETQLGRRVVLRDVKLLCRRLGFVAPARTLHAARHTFAVNYLRQGGSVFHLKKVLGHSTLEMTRRYANLMTEDSQAVHERV